jgi:hypothetical protein
MATGVARVDYHDPHIPAMLREYFVAIAQR